MNSPPSLIWTPTRVAKLTAVALSVYAVGYLLIAVRAVLLLGFLAVVLATLLCFPIDWIARRLPRWLGVLLTLLLFAAVIAATVVLIVPVLRRQLDALPGQLAHARDLLRHFWRTRGGGESVGQKLAEAASPQAAPTALPLARHLLEGTAATVLLIVLSFFLAATRDSLREGGRRLVPSARLEVFDELWSRIGTGLRHWTGGVVVSMTVMGLFTGFGLYFAGIEAPVLLGLLTFFGTFVPYVGAIASAVPGLAVALGQSPRHFLYALLVYVLVHHLEGYLVQPLVMRRAVRLPPALLVFWQAMMGMALGLAGVLVATPLLACVQICVGYLWVERQIRRPPPSSSA